MNNEILDFARSRGIAEILHFTTNRGLVGILASGAVNSRARLGEDQYLENIRLYNCKSRSDQEWIDYVNLSISKVNNRMLGSSKGWHVVDQVWWAVLSFTPDILADDGVWFTTTNNTYTGTVRRAPGLEGLKDLYSEPIPWGWKGSQSWRHARLSADRPTNDQAEVLYPGAVPLTKLQAIYVHEEEHLDDVDGLFTCLPSVPRVPVSCRPEVFL